MLSDKFYTNLEFKITEAFTKEEDKKLRTYWCDGITKPDNEVNFNLIYIEEFSKLELKSWFGKTGQEIYQLILNFGEKSKLKISRNEEIIDCIPMDNKDWIILDEDNKVLEIQLN